MTEENIQKPSKLAGIYSLAGGVIGVLSSVSYFMGILSSGNILAMVTGVILTAISAAIAWGGWLLFRDPAKGRSLLIPLYLIQLPVLFLKGIVFNLFCPLSLAVGLGANGDFFLRWYAGAGFKWALGAAAPSFEFAGINVVAVLLLFLLRK